MKHVNHYERAIITDVPLRTMTHIAAAIAITETFGFDTYIRLAEEAMSFDESSGLMTFEQKLDWALHTADWLLDRTSTYSI